MDTILWSKCSCLFVNIFHEYLHLISPLSMLWWKVEYSRKWMHTLFREPHQHYFKLFLWQLNNAVDAYAKIQFSRTPHWGKNPYFIPKFTFLKSQFSQNSHLWILIFHKIHNFELPKSREFLDKNWVFAPVWAMLKLLLLSFSLGYWMALQTSIAIPGKHRMLPLICI